jgi:integrase
MLTKAKIEKTKTPTTGQIVLWCEKLPGFGCRVFPSGQRSFVVCYRLRGARQKHWVTLGTYGLVTLEQARDKAEEILAKVKLGEDPQAERRARAEAALSEARVLMVGGLVQRYSGALRAGTASSKRLRGKAATPAYIADTALHLERFAERYRKQPAATISRADVQAALNEYIEQPSVHRRMYGAIHRMFRWARRTELVANDPTADIETTFARPRERVLSLEELALIWRAAGGLEPLYCNVVHLMITTGQRRNEVAGMRWGEIDLARGLWTLPGDRTKARRQHIVTLPSLAIAVLQARRKALLRAPEVDDLVLPAISRDGKGIAPVSGWAWLKREIDKRAEIAPWQLHDFRRSLVTHLAEKGADVAVLDSMLNHAASATRGGVIGVYQRASLREPMRKVIALWDELLRNALDQGNVVRLPRDVSASPV